MLHMLFTALSRLRLRITIAVILTRGGDWLWMHGHGFPPLLLDALVRVQYLTSFPDLALAIRQHYLQGVLPAISPSRSIGLYR